MRRPSTAWSLGLGVLGVAAATAVALRLDLEPGPELTRFRDDAYYYFVWARNLAAGDGPCVTPGVPTSGVQLLWAWLLAAVAWIAGPGVLPAAAQGLGLAAHVATAAVVARMAPWGGGFGLACSLVYLANPMLLAEAQNGQETALACLLLAGLSWAALRAVGPWFELLAVACVLARSDLWLAVPFLALARHGLGLRALAAPALSLGVLLAADLAVCGHALPDAAAPIPWLFAENRARHPELVEATTWWWLRPVLLGGPYALVGPVLGGALVAAALGAVPGLGRSRPVALGLLGATAAAGLVGASDLVVPAIAFGLLALLAAAPLGDRDRARLALALLCGLAALVFAHYVWRRFPRLYYFAPFGVAGAFALGTLHSRSARVAALAAVAALAWGVGRAVTPARSFPWQEEFSMAGRFARELIGDEAIGAFNAGLITWRHPGRVVNLDGVVNHDAFAALRARRLRAYLDDLGVRFVMDAPLWFRRDDPWPHASGRYFAPDFDARTELEEIARFDVPGAAGPVEGTETVRLYWRVGRGEAPARPRAARDLGPTPRGGRYVLWPARPGVRLWLRPADGGAPVELARGEGSEVWILAVRRARPGDRLEEDGRREAVFVFGE